MLIARKEPAMKVFTLKQPDPRIDAIENEQRAQPFFRNKWTNWEHFKLLATFGPMGAALMFALVWYLTV